MVFTSGVMTVVGFIAVFKSNKRPIRYLDIPLMFLASAITIVFEMYVSYANPLSLLPGFLALIPSAFYIVRCIQWFIDVKKKRRIPQRKNIIVVIAYVVATLLMCSLLFVDFSVKKQNPTSEEIKLVNECYDYTEKYLINLPADKAILQEIERITAVVTKDDTFVKAYENSLFNQKEDSSVIIETAKTNIMNRRIVYAKVVALRLKTLMALKDYESYNEFFVKNSGYLFSAGLSYYLDLWVNDTYILTERDIEVIVQGYENTLGLCEDDLDRYFILGDIIDFYNEFDPDNERIDNFEKKRDMLLSSLQLEEYFIKSNKKQGYLSEKLAIE